MTTAKVFHARMTARRFPTSLWAIDKKTVRRTRMLDRHVIMLTLVLTVIYRQLTAKSAREKAPRVAIMASLFLTT